MVDCEVLHRALLNQGFVELPIQAAHISRVASLPLVHRDPFNRLLVAQAMVESLSLLTSDATLKGYGLLR